LSQTFKNIEYLVVDGASTDGTVALLEKYQQQNLLKFISEPDGGLYEAMNQGIKLSTGDLIMFLNAGDYFVSKEVIDFYLSKIKMDEADLFFGRIVWIDPLQKSIVLSDSSSITEMEHLKTSNFPHPATIYKKGLFYKFGFFDETYTILGDYEWNVRALVVEKARFQYVDLIATVFFADGISNNLKMRDKRSQETRQIKNQYFAAELSDSFNKKEGEIPLKGFRGKILSNSYNKKLNRVY
jgi:glycosyltransferase involved in cell wall biosynthesis